MSPVTRFAPSPTGPLHLGHAFAAFEAQRIAGPAGRFLLRIEDIDQSRARPEWEEQIYDDLAWLGLSWEQPVMRQSDHLSRYRAALERLWEDGLLYRCSCRRKDIENALSAPQEGVEPAFGPDGLIYPGTCRETGRPDPSEPMPNDTVLRLDMARAVARTGDLWFVEEGSGPNGETGRIALPAAQVVAATGDIILARRDMGTSYHLSVVVDDALQGITHVTRGQDLFEATQIHRVLQTLLDLPQPIYHHHGLIRDETGKRLAKRDDARAIAKYREDGAKPEDIRRMLSVAPSAP